MGRVTDNGKSSIQFELWKALEVHIGNSGRPGFLKIKMRRSLYRLNFLGHSALRLWTYRNPLNERK
jgi:hypothetical protein